MGPGAARGVRECTKAVFIRFDCPKRSDLAARPNLETNMAKDTPEERPNLRPRLNLALREIERLVSMIEKAEMVGAEACDILDIVSRVPIHMGDVMVTMDFLERVAALAPVATADLKPEQDS